MRSTGRSLTKRARKGVATAGLAIGVPFLDHLFRWVFRSCRQEDWGWDSVAQLHAAGKQVLFCYWHRWAIHHLYRFSGGGHITMSSRKDSGELGYRVLRNHGYLTVRGASGVLSHRGWKDRGGREALSEMVRVVLETGYDAGLTVDGPHGPPLVVKRGIVLLARETGAPVVPLAVASAPRGVLPTWDRMHIPLPFSRIFYLFGEPLFVPPSDDEQVLEEHLKVLQSRMLALTQQAEQWFASCSGEGIPGPPAA